MDKDNIIKELFNDLMGLGKEIGIEQERLRKILIEVIDLALTNPANIEIYNTITVNYTEREQRLLFYCWGRLTSIPEK